MSPIPNCWCRRCCRYDARQSGAHDRNPRPVEELHAARAGRGQAGSAGGEQPVVRRRLWSLSPVTFSGGEQQRVNIARGLLAAHPILLVDEPTSSLDAANRSIVVTLLKEVRAAGTAIVAICHDAEAREALATRFYNLPPRELAA